MERGYIASGEMSSSSDSAFTGAAALFGEGWVSVGVGSLGASTNSRVVGVVDFGDSKLARNECSSRSGLSSLAGGSLEDAADAFPGTGKVDERAASGDCASEFCELPKGHQPMMF